MRIQQASKQNWKIHAFTWEIERKKEGHRPVDGYVRCHFCFIICFGLGGGGGGVFIIII